jgi:spermidine/putrescine transport system permease protein
VQRQKHSTLGVIYFVLLAALLYAPIILLIIFSFNDSNQLTFPLKGFTLKWYEDVINNDTLIDAAWGSLVVGVVSSLISTILGTIAAIGIVRYEFPGKNLFLSIAAMPLVIPSIVMGVALLIVFRQILDMPLSLWTVGLGHVVINIPVTMLIVAARLAGFPDSLEEAAIDLGANYWEMLWRVTLPMSLPALVAAFLTAFTGSFDEYAMSVLIIGTEPTLPVYIYSQLRFPKSIPRVVTLAAVLMLLSVIILLIAEWLRRVGETQPDKPREG